MKGDQAYELLAHLVASAETCTREPRYYGSFRLLDGASRLIGYMLEDAPPEEREWLQGYQERLDEAKLWMMSDRERYFRFLEEAAGPLAAELKRRSGA